jgi:hypothetical protein
VIAANSKLQRFVLITEVGDRADGKAAVSWELDIEAADTAGRGVARQSLSGDSGMPSA